MPRKTIHWGFIGLGKIAHKFAQDLLTVEDTKLYAVASRSLDKAHTIANTYNAVKAYNSYEALANDPNIDVVYIATPHSLHKENTLLCLERGIAVLCEKPFAMNLDEVNQMIASAKANNTLLMEALWTYFLPHYKHVLELLKNQTYGKVLKLEADFGFYRAFDNNSRLFNKSLGGGSLLDIGIYPIFTALSTLGFPDEIDAQATFFENNTDASCNTTFKYNNGTKAYLKSSLQENTPTEAIFYCESGTIKINTQFHRPSSVTISHKGKEETIDFRDGSLGYKYEIMHFNELFRQGKTESDIMTFSFSKQLISLLDETRALINLKY